jgi:hypothetical protein
LGLPSRYVIKIGTDDHRTYLNPFRDVFRDNSSGIEDENPVEEPSILFGKDLERLVECVQKQFQ